MGRNEKKYGTIGLMILTVIIIFSVVGIVIAGFRMIKKNGGCQADFCCGYRI